MSMVLHKIDVAAEAAGVCRRGGAPVVAPEPLDLARKRVVSVDPGSRDLTTRLSHRETSKRSSSHTLIRSESTRWG